GSATTGTSAPASPSSTSTIGKAATASQGAPSSAAAASIAVPGSPIITENGSVRLTATYKTASATAGLLGYQMTVTVANQGTGSKTGWVLTVTLPRPTLLVSGVQGAKATQNGSVWTFVPDATTSTVAAGGSVQVVFGVHGATLIDAAPQDCRIDGNPCSA
ncbi:cellulose binding domain-containing protein, partial [Actinoplanes sp. NPDC051411]|uniref:cellulose binding domain-containing protein n=1 Tax=Actinoplanes sp. NPDC051411 TaxID=3155522 RepID=UPI003421C1A1